MIVGMLNRSAIAVLMSIIRGYRLVLSPLIGANCRFYPTCSGYAIEALQRHGLIKGGWLATRRILRCHPWGGSGIDLVPDSNKKDTVTGS